ncbi:protein of unknown function [Bradyrhizobium vignae]|uniref:Uncharacterized protein n=1 Tax=Bradyrhizobium vignae TaxID=1549949 RepID=A0A2U3QCF3_9BRAD|nr:protein of unknown function [Bradyrhizobium vignae]
MRFSRTEALALEGRVDRAKRERGEAISPIGPCSMRRDPSPHPVSYSAALQVRRQDPLVNNEGLLARLLPQPRRRLGPVNLAGYPGGPTSLRTALASINPLGRPIVAAVDSRRRKVGATPDFPRGS